MKIKIIQDLIDKARGTRSRKKIVKNGNNNLVDLVSDKNIKTIRINGNNNSIISKSADINLTIIICGEDNIIEIEDNVTLCDDYIYIGTSDAPVQNCTIKIGRDTSSNGMTIRLGENDSKVSIGENCLFSSGINLWCTDTHSIFDSKNELINKGKFIKIGNHVWCGMDVKIGKNLEIQNDTIIGWGSVVTKTFDQQNIIIAGNPARIVKENISWDSKRPQYFLSSSNINFTN